MSHYALLDENNIVIGVYVASDADDGQEEGVRARSGENYRQTSYNTRGGVHYDSDGLPDEGTPYRMNYAGIGYTYDAGRDAFIPPRPFPSWLLNEDTCLWNAPTPYPTDNKQYTWDEETTSWVEVE
jgi:hypothetical protein